MKAIITKKIAMIIALSIVSLIGLAQSPQGFSYQAVIRNGSGEPIANRLIGLKITLQNPSQEVYYSETHTPTSNAHGVITVTIGGGTLVGINPFKSIPWEKGDVLIKLDIDPDGGNNYTQMGNPTILQSVPYALFADNTKEVVSAPDAIEEDPIFVVKNKAGKIVFAVYQTGVRVYVEDGGIKGAKGGFAVGGLTNQSKGNVEYLRITPDSARIFVNDVNSVKGAKGGFAVGGLINQSKGEARNLMFIASDSTRFYIDGAKAIKGAKGGFAVGGLINQSKGTSPERFMFIDRDSTRIYVNNGITKGAKGGFAVGGLINQSKGGLSNNFMEVTPDSTRIYVSNQTLSNSSSLGGFAIKSKENIKNDYFNISSAPTAGIIKNESRVMWYPTKSALLAGEISVAHPDSVGQYSVSLGYHNIAKGNYSQAMGYNSVARGDYSTAMGYEAVASNNSFSFGSGSKALGFNSFAFGGKGVNAVGTILNTYTAAMGNFSFAFGLGSVARELGSFVLGVNCESSGKFAIATGFGSKATGANATAMGLNTEASGIGSFASGNNSKAIGLNSTAMGVDNTSSGTSAFTLGSSNTASNTYSFAIGSNNKAYGTASVALGLNNTTGILGSSTAGYTAFAAGSSNTASGDNSIAAGTLNVSSGVASTAFGRQNTASGNRSFAIGYGTASSKVNSVAMGHQTVANADNSVAMGYQTNTTGTSSLAIGENTQAIGNSSVAAGYLTTAQPYASFVIGQYNTTIAGNATAWQSTDPLFVAGNGNDQYSYNDALVLYKNGNLKVDGSVYPNDNGGPTLGSSINRWAAVYAVNGIIQTSDIRLKKNIMEIGYGLSEILKLRPVSFLWKDNEQQGVKLGLIAQEVKPIISEVVDISEDKEQILGINYSSLIPVLIKSIQEQQQIIDKQKQKNEQLEKLLLELTNRLELVEQKLK